MIGEADVSAEILAQLAPPAWMRDAACVEHPDLAWFPARGTDPAAIADCRRICNACLVREECLEYVRDLGIVDGIWGGLTPAERSGRHDRLRAQRAASKVSCSTCGRPVAKLHDGECWACHCTAA